MRRLRRGSGRRCALNSDVNHKLRERIKELTALHKTAKILQDDETDVQELFSRVVLLLPDAWQYPGIVAARIRCADWVVSTVGFRVSDHAQISVFEVNEISGAIEVYYLEDRPSEDEGPFLKEERELIDSIAEMLRSYIRRKRAEADRRNAMNDLETLVEYRTNQLRQLTQELCLAEARERREIASDLHDHIGQALALIRMNVSKFRSNAVFCGFENQIGEILTLIDQTIRYTRDLTGIISPPVLYELGLVPALEWLSERTKRRFGLAASVRASERSLDLPENIRVIVFKCIGELIINVVKHSRAKSVQTHIIREQGRLVIDVKDDGVGFNDAMLSGRFQTNEHFGLFSIRERLRLLGGELTLKQNRPVGAHVQLNLPLERGHDDASPNPDRR